MNSIKRKTIRILVAVSVAAIMMAAIAAPANVAFGVGEIFVKVVDGGIGDINNDRVASMAIYDGHLYVGLNNEVTGGEVWRVSIVGDTLGTDWVQVNDDGFGDDDNIRVRALQVFKNKLYAGTRNPSDGCQIWRTGAVGGPPFTDWTQVGGNGLGYPGNNKRIASMAVYNGDLYAGTHNTNNGCHVFKSTDGVTWVMVNKPGFKDSDNTIASWMISYNGYLYVGTRNEDTGVEVRRTAGAGGPPYTDWRQVNSDGFGDAANNHAASMAVFNGYLYVGTANEDTGAQIWRTAGAGGPPYPFTDWTQVNISGFGSSDNIGAMSMAVSDGLLYVGTLSDTGTAELWQTADGVNWNNVPISGFWGNERIATMIAGSPVYLGTGNPDGAEVWMQTLPPAPDGMVCHTSLAAYNGTEATTTHTFSVWPGATGGYVLVEYRGDFGYEEEFIDVYIEGDYIGSGYNTSFDCNENWIAAGWPLTAGQLSGWAADGTISVTVANSWEVNDFCDYNQHRVTLCYSIPPVGGEAYPVSKASLLAPWIAVAVLLIGGISWYVLRRRKAQS